MSTLGERIKYAREAKGFLQSELATLIGVKSSGVISNWEKNLNKPDAEKIVKLCDVLDITASFLLDYYGKSSFEFSPAEKEHIEKYRALDPFGQETVSYILDRETSRVQLIRKLEKPDAPDRSPSFYEDSPATPEELEQRYPPVDLENIDAV